MGQLHWHRYPQRVCALSFTGLSKHDQFQRQQDQAKHKILPAVQSKATIKKLDDNMVQPICGINCQKGSSTSLQTCHTHTPSRGEFSFLKDKHVLSTVERVSNQKIRQRSLIKANQLNSATELPSRGGCVRLRIIFIFCNRRSNIQRLLSVSHILAYIFGVGSMLAMSSTSCLTNSPYNDFNCKIDKCVTKRSWAEFAAGVVSRLLLLP